LLGRVKSRLAAIADARVPQLAAKDADLEGIGVKRKAAVRHTGSEDELVAP